MPNNCDIFFLKKRRKKINIYDTIACQRSIQNPVKQLSVNTLRRKLTAENPSLFSQKNSILDVRQGSGYASTS